MRIDPALQLQVARLFAPLNTAAAVNALPRIGALASSLQSIVPSGSTTVETLNINPSIAKLFPTAAVNMWLRAVHSFFVSSSLTNVSPVWASVSGYYSSHYSVRGLAHLLGYFQLFTLGRTVRLTFTSGHFVGTFKVRRVREHQAYWKVVKSDPLFSADPLFTDNTGADSDVAHRDRANYADHLPQFPVFHPLDAVTLKNRIQRISEIEFTSPPIPSRSKYPDIEAVQIIAYHRLVRFRDLLDTILGDHNRFWTFYRDPGWARNYVDFQLTEAAAKISQLTVV